MNETQPEKVAEVRSLSKAQRRVLGVLVEKAFTTPEYYPLTLKAITTGCNQKSNRDPVTNYSEDDVQEVLEELRELGLVAVVHTESGRTERYRHYMRRRFTFTEPQLAILTELLLRGQQTLGELRGRASRMVPIDALDQLRDEVGGLQEQGFVRAGGDLHRRGIEIDHCFYTPREQPTPLASPDDRSKSTASAAAPPTASHGSAAEVAEPTLAAGIAGSDVERRVSALERTVEELRRESERFRDELASLTAVVRTVQDGVNQLRSELGG